MSPEEEIAMRTFTIAILLGIFGFLSFAQDKETFTSEAEIVIQSLKDKNFSQLINKFDQAMSQALGPISLSMIWYQYTWDKGSWQSVTSSRYQNAPPYHIVIATCQFEKGQINIKVVFNDKKQVAGLFFLPAHSLPSYADLTKVHEEEIVIGKGDFAVSGTLTTPLEGEKFPVIILIHGSGPSDRDVTIGPNKPFLDLAMGLAVKGIATLRYDKRTYTHGNKITGKIAEDFTVQEEFVEDALAAIDFLEQNSKINRNKIFLIGHSMGGEMLPRIAQQTKKVAGFIAMAAPSRPLVELIWEQYNYIFSLDGSISKEEKEKLAQLKIQIEKVKNITRESPVEGVIGAYPKYWLDLKGYSPVKIAKTIDKPWLILQGERDYQVTMKDFAGWKEGMQKHKGTTLHTYPKLNHLFIAGSGASTPQEYQVAGNVEEKVIQDIANWIETLSQQDKNSFNLDSNNEK